MTTPTNHPATTATPASAGMPQHICDSCRRRPGTWHATFADGVAFDVCDDCVGLVDARVTLTRAPSTSHRNGDYQA